MTIPNLGKLPNVELLKCTGLAVLLDMAILVAICN